MFTDYKKLCDEDTYYPACHATLRFPHSPGDCVDAGMGGTDRLLIMVIAFPLLLKDMESMKVRISNKPLP